MPSVNSLFNNSAWGQVSQSIHGRIDLPVYQNGWSYGRNFIFHSLGFTKYRPGSKYYAGTNANKKGFLHLFDFGSGQAYMLEFTAGKIRFMTPTGFVLSGGNPVEVSTSYAEADLFGLQFAQVYNKLYIVHNSYAPKVLVRTSATSFTLNDISFVCGPMDDENQISTHTFTASSTTGSVTVTSSTSYFASTDVGRHIFMRGSTSLPGGWGIITAYTNPTTVTMSVQETLDNNNATRYWRMGAFQSGNYPGSVAINQQRLVLGSTPNAPLKEYCSKTALYEDFTPGTNDDDAFSFSVGGQKMAKVNFISSLSNGMAIGTNSGTISVRPSANSAAITPTDINTSGASDYIGSAPVMALNIENSIVYVDRKKTGLRGLVYDALNESFKATDFNLVSDDVLTGEIVQTTYSKMSPDIVWAVTSDGKLFGLTYLKEENISCWHQHDFGGEVVSAESFPQVGDDDILFIVVKRVINGSEKYYIETIEPDIRIKTKFDYFSGVYDVDNIRYLRNMWECQKKLIRLDSALVYDGTNTARSITLSSTTGDITITASGSAFSSGNVGDEIWVKAVDGIGYGRAKITAYTSNTVVSATVTEDFNTTTYAAGGWYLTAQTFSGLTHLEGETVKVVADGGVSASEYVVTGGVINIDAPASYVVVGLPYTGLLVSLPLEGGGINGTSQTKPKNVTKVNVRFYQTNGCKIGTDAYNLKPLEFRDNSSYLNRPTALFSGDREVLVRDSTDISKGVVVLQDTPQPCTILLLTPFFKTSDGG